MVPNTYKLALPNVQKSKSTFNSIFFCHSNFCSNADVIEKNCFIFSSPLYSSANIWYTIFNIQWSQIMFHAFKTWLFISTTEKQKRVEQIVKVIWAFLLTTYFSFQVSLIEGVFHVVVQFDHIFRGHLVESIQWQFLRFRLLENPRINFLGFFEYWLIV